MALAAWWYEDGWPQAEAHAGVTVEAGRDDRLIASMAALPVEEVLQRRAGGHRPYVARVKGTPAGYGWVATTGASIGELDLTFELPPGHRYLWDFATLPTFRGRGVYPELLAEIIRRECPPATRCWIIHAPENLPSGIGIARAGFQPVAELSFDGGGRAALAPIGGSARAEVAAAVFGLPVAASNLDPCWGCRGCPCDHEAPGAPCACAIVPTR